MTAALGPARRRLPSASVAMAGLALLFVAAGMVLSAGVDVVEHGDGGGALMLSALVTGAVGLAMWRYSYVPANLPPRVVFAAVAWSWIAMSVAGALPFLFGGVFHNFDDAFFESVSGFTGTGSSIFTLADFELTSPGILWWRQLTQWFGGMGFIVLAVAVLPFLGVGGLELIAAEAPGPSTDRLAPRVSATAKRLWLVYIGLTLAGSIGLFVAGLSWFDATANTLTAVSTGGFSPNPSSIGGYHSVAVEVVTMVIMFLGAVSFTLHYRAALGSPGAYFKNSEFRAFVGILVVFITSVTAVLAVDGYGVGESLRASSFNVISLITSTGFGNATGPDSIGNFVLWAPAAQAVLLACLWSGSMTGSTSGAVKILRSQVMGRVAWRELVRVRRVRAVRPIKQGNETISQEIVSRIIGFVLLYFLIAVVATLVLTLLGTDIITSFSATLTAMGGVGPALGDAGPTSNFLVFSRPARFVLDVLMLIGRLEIFPILLVGLVVIRRLRYARPPTSASGLPGTGRGAGSRHRSGTRTG